MAEIPASSVPPTPPSPSPTRTPTPSSSVLPHRFPPSPAETDKADSDGADSTHIVGDETCNDKDSVRLYPLPPPSRVNKVLAEDLKTPDRHVERDPRLIRLTGIHPFNTEAPLSDLYNEGFLTSKDLHYVRNHGAVPRVEDNEILDWTFSVEGMVANPSTMTLRQLLADYEQYTYPITLVCAGNRRKEQNIVRKTKGFSWGAAGLSTAIWTGVPLGDLLERAKPLRGARFVCFEGADKLPNGYYGTSVKLAWARNVERGIILAHKMNGETLAPDHGKPLRIVVPGQIGGRSVKWIKRIIVTAEPSDNWYHIYDNRVLPTMISPEASADRPDIWRDERYAIYDLNSNSAICFPAHEERLHISPSQSNENSRGMSTSSDCYKVRGYAYAGGGKRVTRIEITLDQGKTWQLANLDYPEDAYRLATDGETLYGGRVDIVAGREACFCWCFWDLDVPIAELQRIDDIMVRCMDDSMMVQPRDMYWSVLGMMNNPWFRVVIHKEADGQTLRFEHPAPPKMTDKGWMDRVKQEGGNLTNGFWGEKMSGEDADNTGAAEKEPEKEICMTDESKLQTTIALDELQKHENDDAPWFIVHGQVYDGTTFLEGHPGGATSITGAAGQDVTEEFMAIHSENAKAMMPSYHIGALDKDALAKLGDSDSAEPKAGNGEDVKRPLFLQSKAWTKANLVAKTSISSDSKIFSFQLEHPDQRLGLPTGQHLMIRLRDPVTREAIMRAYTPLSMDMDVETTEVTGVAGVAGAVGVAEPENTTVTAVTARTMATQTKGILDILIKIYYDQPGRPGGRMTQALDSLPLGHSADFKGPIGHFAYEGAGVCALGGGAHAKQRTVWRFIMICGGSGITPVYQVLRAVLAANAATDPTQCLLLDGNRTEEDILCRAELDQLAAAHPDRFRLVHILSKPDDKWTGLRGRMDAGFFAREVGKPRLVTGNDDREATAEDGQPGQNKDLVLVCGPEPMEKSVRQIFADMGWQKEDLHFF